jgi:hypothetical protein
MALDMRTRITCAIERNMNMNLANRFIGDVYDEDGLCRTGIFTLMYDESNAPYIVTLSNGIMQICTVNTMDIKVVVDKVDGVYSFPTNPANVSRVLLIELYKVLEGLLNARNEAGADDGTVL